MTAPRRLVPWLAALLVAWTLTAEAARPHSHGAAPRGRPAHSTVLRRQAVAPGTVHVHDGDTFYSGAETIRVHGIDTPELGQPRATAAKWRLIQLLHSGPVTIVPRAEDVYGRTVADVYVGGRNIADVLRREGFEKPRPSPPAGRRGR